MALAQASGQLRLTSCPAQAQLMSAQAR